MSIWSNVKGRKAPGYKDEVLRDYSHYKDPLDTTEGRLSGISRKCGDVSAETSDLVKTLLVNEWKAAGLSDDLISVGLAIVSVESGFNPDAASNESAAGFGQFVTRDIVQNNQTYASRWTQLVNRYNAEHPNDQISNDPSHYDDGKGSFFDVTAQAKVMAYQINDLYGKMAEFVINANGKSPDANNYSRELIMYAVHHQGINASWDNVQRFLENPRNLELFSWLETNFSISTIIFTTNADDTGILPSDKIAEIGKLQNSPWLSFLIRNGFDNQLLQCHQSFTTATTAQSPLILDLDGDGVETTLATDGAYFDHDGNGFAEQTGWASSDDGALVWDRNNDGRINDGKELFGNETLLQNGSKATNGFQALAEWDENTDGKIDSNDSIWSNLKVWQDYDGDGYSSADEFLSLSDLSISSINTGYTESSFVDDQGNEHRQVGGFTWSDGTSGAATDVWFKADKMYTIAEEWLDIPEDIAALPDLQGYGNVYDLHQAMVRDTSGELKTLVENFMAEADPSIRNNLLEQILFNWTGSEGIDPESRGPYIDARRLAVLEKLFGEGFVGTQGPNPHHGSAKILNQSYRGIFEMFYAGLMAQTHLKDFYDKIIFTWDEATQSLRGDLSEVITELQNQIAIDSVAGKEVLGEFARTLCGFDAEDMVDYVSFRNTFAAQSEELAWVIDTAGNVFVGTIGNDSIFGNGTPDHLYGYGGNDVLYGMDGDDLIEGGEGTDYLYGGVGNDFLNGGRDNDYLYGETGSDTYLFSRGSGQDTIYEYDPTPGNMDTLRFLSDVSRSDVEMTRYGNDMIFRIKGTSEQVVAQYWMLDPSYQLERVEFGDGVVLTAQEVTDLSADIRGTEYGDNLMGSSVADRLYGYGGDDILYGQAGGDWLYGGAGDDTLDGGSDNDYLYGEMGNDTYVVDNTGDIVTEALSEGTDTVKSYITYTLGANVENLTLMGTGAVNGTGNGLNNIITGNSGNNILSGGSGNDSLKAGAGADTLDGGAGNDYLEGSTGNDLYLLGRGYGQDTIKDYDTASGNTDTVKFNSGLNPIDLVFAKSGNNLKIQINNSSDLLTVQNQNDSTAYHAEVFEVSDGNRLLASSVNLLIQAMAEFSAENNGMSWTQLIQEKPTDVQQILAQYWQPPQ